jgi:hypothetical protein
MMLSKTRVTEEPATLPVGKALTIFCLTFFLFLHSCEDQKRPPENSGEVIEGHTTRQNLREVV